MFVQKQPSFRPESRLVGTERRNLFKQIPRLGCASLGMTFSTEQMKGASDV
jgi:hypothetical protein